MSIKIREAIPADAEGIAKVQEAVWTATYKGLIDDKFLEEMTWQKRKARWENVLSQGERICFVAEEEKIEGFISGGRTRDDVPYSTEIFALYVNKDQQGKGIGNELVKAFAAKASEQGDKSLVVWVLEGNPYEKFYQKLGGEYFKTDTITLGDKQYSRRGYGWKDIRVLL